MNDFKEDHTTDIVALNNDNLITMADQAERRIEAINRIMAASLKMTNERDWVKIGGSPYLQESGASKVARLFGVSWTIAPPLLFAETDGHFMYTYTGEFSMGAVSIEATGSRSSKDEFFTGKATLDKPAKKPEDIDRRDVMISAFTNCINNGIKQLVPGLRNLEMSDLTAAGLDINKIRGYGFKSGEQHNEDSNANQDKVRALLKEICGDDVKAQGDVLEAKTAFKSKQTGEVVKGRREVDRISDKQMEYLIPTLEKMAAAEKATRIPTDAK